MKQIHKGVNFVIPVRREEVQEIGIKCYRNNRVTKMVKLSDL